MRITILIACLFITGQAYAGNFQITSTEIAPGKPLTAKQVFNGFGCNGENISPQLSWNNAPTSTKSFAVTVYDPDAPTGSGWWHWVILNIPASVTILNTNAGDPASGVAPKGSAQIRTDFGTAGFGGACPPAGSKPHRYQFRVFALDVDKLDLPADSTAALAGFYLHAHALDTATLEAIYSR